MRIRQMCAYMLMAGGILLFAGGASQAEQSKSGTKPDSTMGSGSGSGSPGGSSGTMKQGHESSGNMGVEPQGRTGEPKVGGEATLGGSGQIPDSSKVPGKGSSGGSGTGSGTGSGSMGSSGGTGSSGGGGGY